MTILTCSKCTQTYDAPTPEGMGEADFRRALVECPACREVPWSAALRAKVDALGETLQARLFKVASLIEDNKDDALFLADVVRRLAFDAEAALTTQPPPKDAEPEVIGEVVAATLRQEAARLLAARADVARGKIFMGRDAAWRVRLRLVNASAVMSVNETERRQLLQLAADANKLVIEGDAELEKPLAERTR